MNINNNNPVYRPVNSNSPNNTSANYATRAETGLHLLAYQADILDKHGRAQPANRSLALPEITPTRPQHSAIRLAGQISPHTAMKRPPKHAIARRVKFLPVNREHKYHDANANNRWFTKRERTQMQRNAVMDVKKLKEKHPGWQAVETLGLDLPVSRHRLLKMDFIHQQTRLLNAHQRQSPNADDTTIKPIRDTISYLNAAASTTAHASGVRLALEITDR